MNGDNAEFAGRVQGGGNRNKIQGKYRVFGRNNTQN